MISVETKKKALKLVEMATTVVKARVRQQIPKYNRANAAAIHAKQAESFEIAMLAAMQPFFRSQIKAAIQRLRALSKGGYIDGVKCGGPGGTMGPCPTNHAERNSSRENLISELESKGYGEASKPTPTSIHAFETVDRMISALSSGSLGRENFTSIGSDKSKIAKSYQNQIWIKTPKEAERVFYVNETTRDHADKMKEVEKLGVLGKEVQFEHNKKEQESFVRGKIAVSPLNVKALVYDEYASKDEVSSVKEFANKLGVPAYHYDEFRRLQYSLLEIKSYLLKSSGKSFAKDVEFLGLKQAHSYSSTQFNVEDAGYSRSQGSPLSAIQQMVDWIDDKDLAEDGKETEFHVTAKYGLHTDDSLDVEKVVAGFGPVSAKLGKVSIFENDDKDFDVVKIDVDSPDLHRLNKLLSESLEVTDTFPDYHPHLTLAYVKKGEGAKYVGMDDVDGYELNWDVLLFSNKDRMKFPINLLEAPSTSKQYQSTKTPKVKASQIFDPKEWNEKLIKAALPVIAKASAEAAMAQWIQIKDQVKVQKGVKASTATDYFSGLDSNNQSKLNPVLFTTPVGSVSIGFMTEYPAWMKEIIQQRLTETFVQPYWEDINVTTGNDIESLLNEGLLDGWSIEDMANEMESRYGSTNYPKQRGLLIARTESGNALNGARSDVIDSLQDELGDAYPMRKVWLSVLGNTTRDTHANLDGVPAAKADRCWALGGIRCRWPGDVFLPAAERCNCFPSGVLVSGDFTGSQKAWYEGIITEVVSRVAGTIPMTVNHPVMTSKGWVAAGSLKPGDKIVAYGSKTDGALLGSDSSFEFIASCDKIENKPIPIEKIFEAFFGGAVAGRGVPIVESRRPQMDDFYGDGVFFKGDIQIVRANWELLRDVKTTAFEKVGNSIFIRVPVSLSQKLSQGGGGFGGNAFFNTGGSLPGVCEGSSDQVIAICRLSPSNSLGVGLRSNCDTPFFKALEKYGGADSSFLDKISDRLSQLISSNQVVFDCENLPLFDFSVSQGDAISAPGPDSDSSSNESIPQDRVIAAGDFCDFENGCATEVFFDEVVEIRKYSFSGHVYDLQSEYGYIIAHDPTQCKVGIVTRNCQCSLVTEFGLLDDEAGELIADYELRQLQQGKSFIDCMGVKCNGPLATGGTMGPCPGPKKDKDGNYIPGSVGKIAGIDTSSLNKLSAWSQLMMSEISTLEDLYEAGNYSYLKIAKPATEKGKKAKAALIAKVDAAAASIPPAAKPTVADPNVANSAGWKKIGGKLGTEEGGTYELNGQKYYVKQPADENRARNEILALNLYNAAGAQTVNGNLLQIEGKLSVATEWIDKSEKVDWAKPANKVAAAEDFAVHAWLNNRDAIGAGSEKPEDNIRLDLSTNKLTLVDAGGSLDYKGMGGSGKKPFTFQVNEWDTFRDPSINPTMAKVFGGMTTQQLIDSTKKLKNVTDTHIDSLVDKFGNGDTIEKKLMAHTLKTRRDNILKIGQQLEDQVNASMKPPPAPAPTASPQSTPTPAVISSPSPMAPALAPPPNIMLGKTKTLDWYQNFQNKFDAIYEHGKKGDIAAIEAIKANPNSTDAYTKKVAKYKADTLEALKKGGQANPQHIVNTPSPILSFSAANSSVTPLSQVATPAPAPKPAALGGIFANLQSPTPAFAPPTPPPVPKITIDPDKFPSNPVFKSTIAHHVQANNAKVQEALDLAKKGDLQGLQGMNLPPSPLLKSWHQSLVGNLSTQLNPPPKPVTLTDDYSSLTAGIKSAPQYQAGKAKVGYWVMLGEAPGIPEGKQPGTWQSSGSSKLWDSGYKAYSSLDLDTQTILREYTGQRYEDLNAALRFNKSTTPAKDRTDAISAANAVMSASVDIEPGLMLSRKHDGVSASTWATVKPGAVISEKAILSTSVNYGVWSGTTHLKLTVGPGVRGLPARDFSSNSPEYEVLLPPNQRFMVTKVEYDGTHNIVHAVVLPTQDDQCCPP